MGTAKALLDYHGEMFLDRLIRIFNETCNSVTVVLGHDPSIQHRIKRGAEATFVTNPDHEKGQLTSLQCGLKAIPANAEAVIFTPVDYPAIEASTIKALIAQATRPLTEPRASATGNASFIVVPRRQGRHGHPVLFAASLIADFLALPPEAEARTVVRRNIANTTYVDVEDPGILIDADDPQAYADLLKATRPAK